MTNSQWEALSNQAVSAAGVVYFLALLALAAEWALLRKTSPQQAKVPTGVPVGAGAPAEGSSLGDVSGTVDDRAEVIGRRTEFAARLGILLTVVACAAHFLGLVARGMAAEPNRVPWGNMYEFTLAGTFCVTLLFLVFYRRFNLHWLAPLVVGFVMVFLTMAVVVLYDPVAPLMEALDSPWLVIHVISAVLATGAFTLGGMASVVYLLKTRAVAKGRGDQGYLGRLPDIKTLDRVAYQFTAFAFPIWTFGTLITGPIWAHEAWGSYWNWDAKEVWAFITWVVYAGYLHARATAGWSGKRAAILALIGLATLWFNFIGVNYFVTSMHSYA